MEGQQESRGSEDTEQATETLIRELFDGDFTFIPPDLVSYSSTPSQNANPMLDARPSEGFVPIYGAPQVCLPPCWKEWTEADVCNWLQSLKSPAIQRNIKGLCEAFIDSDISGKHLPGLLEGKALSEMLQSNSFGLIADLKQAIRMCISTPPYQRTGQPFYLVSLLSFVLCFFFSVSFPPNPHLLSH